MPRLMKGVSSHAPVTAQASSPAITFVLNDAGETKAMTPVMAELDRQGVDYCVLTNQTATKLLGNHPKRVTNDAQLQRAMRVPCVLTGLVSNFQQQWAQWFKDHGKRVMGYYDGFSVNLNRNKADDFAATVTDLMTPSRDMALFFKRHWADKNPNLPIVAMGQPTLESYAGRYSKPSSPELLYQLGLDPRKPTLLWVGGYGKGYAESFNSFCQAVSTMPGVNVILATHPRESGQLEASMMPYWNKYNQFRLLPKGIPTDAALDCADVVLSQESTMATQALFQGKRVMLVGEPSSGGQTSQFNPTVAYGLAQRYFSPSSVMSQLQAWLPSVAMTKQTGQVWAGATPTPETLYGVLGIPQRPTQRIVEYVMGVVQQAKRRAQ